MKCGFPSVEFLRPEAHGDRLEVPAWSDAPQVARHAVRHLLPEAGQLDVDQLGAFLPVDSVPFEVARLWLDRCNMTALLPCAHGLILQLM